MQRGTTKRREYLKDYAKTNRKRIRKNRRDWARRRREEVLRHYGGHCRCCQEPLLEFLGMYPCKGTAMPSSKQSLIDWLTTNGFPEGFQVLCRNCGWALEKLGYCPHHHGVV